MKLSPQMHVLSLATLARTYALKALIYPKLKWNCLVKNSHGRTESLKTLPLSTNLYASLSFCGCVDIASKGGILTPSKGTLIESRVHGGETGTCYIFMQSTALAGSSLVAK